MSTSCTVSLTKSAGSVVASSVKAAVEKEKPERGGWIEGVDVRV